MSMTITAVPIVVTGPEVLPSGVKKYGIALENGSTLVAFSERIYNAVNQNLDTELTFEAEPSDRGGAPKVTKVIKDGVVLYDREQGRQKAGYSQGQFPQGQGPVVVSAPGTDRETAETSRRAVGSAVAIVSSQNQALIAAGNGPMSTDAMLDLIAKLALGVHGVMKDLER